jgi:hypothetical protein
MNARLGLVAVLVFLLATPSQAGTPIFADDFESGDTSAWSQTVGPPIIPNCTCYFSPDCVSGQFCDWGVLTAEDNCLWTIPKPGGVVGAGCNEDFPSQSWAASICDGVCVAAVAGSYQAFEDRGDLIQVIRLWSQAMLEPSRAGGGRVDADLAKEALSVRFRFEHTGLELGRHTTEVLSLSAARGFYDHFCMYEAGHDHEGPVGIDLSDDPCRQEAGRIAVDALVSELLSPGLARAELAGIATFCPAWQGVEGSRCHGPDALACLGQRIEDLARFLSTPRADLIDTLLFDKPWSR